eukprot:UN10562
MDISDHFLIDMNWLADKTHTKIKITTQNTVRETDKVPFATIDRLRRRIIASRKIDDFGYGHGSFRLRYLSDFTEIALVFRENVFDIIRMYNDCGECISIQSEIGRQAINKFVVEAQYDPIYFGQILYHDYLLKQYQNQINAIGNQINQLQDGDIDLKQLNPLKKIKKIRSLLYTDNDDRIQ